MGFTDYHPAPHVLDHLKQINFVAVVGPTAVGKTTLIKAAVRRTPRELHMLVAGTSRDPRPGEHEGVDFHFDSKDAMLARAEKGEYATLVTGVAGDLYATAPEEYPAGKTILLATLASAVPDFRTLSYKSFRTLFIQPPDYQTWQERLKCHGFDATQLRKRLVEAEQSLLFALEDASVQFVVNDAVDVATDDLTARALGRKLDGRQQADQSRARVLAGEFLQQLRRALGQM